MSGREALVLPLVDDPVTAPFWTGARERRVALQRCLRCAYVRWPPARVCPECLAEETRWETVQGRGTIWSFAVYVRALHPAFADDVPYTVAAVELDAGPLMIGRLDEAPSWEPAIGDRVEPAFEDVTPDVTLVRFRVIA